ncbi:hypothetical protein A2334_02370 [Candidatus Roizmanbacteria bacterium RIFOXYB2_FULL_38_10]|uniref:Phosphoglycerate mutase n=1 Tax=Candidatus Roizmanbacteria bacterium RIFOXYD1_FULL_38_12 TaxID=1802093 RepID=A0A1F7L009_9BACT|nr:MAG: hypothetical protein A3K47_01600 [Candidatus Roizmanbacteria bacterium RIFOXYA2_FULL_38_14]OGK63479.1 MAG: hypothetical protein A3K27_01600 [Candidatus Roizmanbacteria bacterium RIFOXYA1_FULL_37_12]OGK65325.1 MAG: hypothetical protein A3K38_01600 [Candidatus Roizmanbacteria bacterium RIFOXYB1_FULL_40_23]OGK67961.1 MAG: hypothetical protein A2334_02370 [Candidatus Roizmanbacteria bacterium RIFOXYB2_FULL_38_10]OGK69730.1 MAG: hypothetical protein A3K21_01605 [Candidatus Roizmanbacteria ba
MPQKIIIIRHGQTANNKKRILQGHLDTPLDEEGKAQSHRAAKILKNRKIDVVFSSDLIRAFQTAQIVTKGIVKHIKRTPLLREKYFGKFQGMTFDEIGSYLTKFGEQGNFSFRGREKEFGVETEDEVIERITEFKKMLVTHKGKTIAIFSHGGFIRRLCIVFGIPKEKIEKVYIPNATPMVLIKKGNTYILEE